MKNCEKIFLFEIYFEDISYKYLFLLKDDIKREFSKSFKKNNIIFNKIKIFISNVRISVLVYKIYFNRLYIEKNNYYKFVNNNIFNNKKNNYFKNIKIKFCIQDNGIYFCYIKKKNKKNLINFLYKISKYIIVFLSKKYNIMHWNNKKIYFIRPIRNIILKLNNTTISGNILDINISNITFYDNNKEIVIENSYSYLKKIKDKNIIIDYKERKNNLNKDILKINKKLNLNIFLRKNIINLYCFSNENPKLLFYKIKYKNSIDYKIIKLIFEKYYNYFLYIKNLYIYFLWVYNKNVLNNKNILKNNINIIKKNVKYINYIYKIDIKNNIFNNIKLLKNVIFRNKLGNIYEKIYRVKKISLFIYRILNLNIKYLVIINIIYKLDIMSIMSNEYNFLKGLMPYYYSKSLNINKKVCKSLENIYYKKFNKKNYDSNILYISDNIDNIIGNLYISIKDNNIDKLIFNDPFFIKKNLFNILLTIIKSQISIPFFLFIKISIFLYKINFNKYYIKIEKFIYKRIILFFLKLKFDKKLIFSVINKNEHFNIYIIYKILKYLTNNFYYKIIFNIYKRISNLLLFYNKHYKPYLNNKNYFKKKNFNYLKKVDLKFFNIIRIFKKHIYFLLKRKKIVLIVNKLLILCNFINNLLKKNLIYELNNEIKNNFYFIFLKKVLKIINCLNNNNYLF